MTNFVRASAKLQQLGFGARRVLTSLTALWCLLGALPLAVAQTTTTTVASTPTSTFVGASLSLASGWNLVGTGAGGRLSLGGGGGTLPEVTSVWKWLRDTTRWAFYAPSLDAQGGTVLADYAASKGYDVLSTIGPGEGFWVNANQAFNIAWMTDGAIGATSFQDGKPGALKQGWNLISIGDAEYGNTKTPSAFNSDMGASPPPAGVVPINITSLWAWDNPLGKWYFYAPSLEAQGGTALADYIIRMGYLDFTANNKTLRQGTGFWVNKP